MQEKLLEIDSEHAFEKAKEHTQEWALSEEQRERYISKLFSEVFEEKNVIGSGSTAKVFDDPQLENECIKLIVNSNDHSDVHQQGEWQELCNQLSYLVKVPRPSYSIISHPAEIQSGKKVRPVVSFLSMEKLNAVTLEDVLNKKVPMPKSFDFEPFFKKLEEFVYKMNQELYLFHKDLQSRNIMIDVQTGEPYVIDFGKAEKFHLSTEITDHNVSPDTVTLRSVKNDVRSFLLT